MKKTILLLPALSVLSVLYSQQAFAGAASISFDRYRVLLDQNTQTVELTLKNTESKNAECLLNLNHFNFSPSNELINLSSDAEAFMPANKLLRYSPRSVTIAGLSNQKVKIGYRHRANLTPGEYVSFFQIACSEKNENLVKGQPTVGAQVNYNLPVHVRIGDISATTSLEFISARKGGEGYTISLKQYRTGERSVIGDLKVIDKSSGEVLTEYRNETVYRPADYKIHNLTFNKKPEGDVLIEFSERNNVFNAINTSIEISNSLFN